MCCWGTQLGGDVEYRLPGIKNAKTWKLQKTTDSKDAEVEHGFSTKSMWDNRGTHEDLNCLSARCLVSEIVSWKTEVSTVDFTCTISLRRQTCVTTSSPLTEFTCLKVFASPLWSSRHCFRLWKWAKTTKPYFLFCFVFVFRKKGITIRMWGIMEVT